MDIPGPLPIVGNPPLGFRFGVFFFADNGDPNPIDTLFQKVSGLRVSVETETLQESGQSPYARRIPKSTRDENLVLERGLVILSPLAETFETAMSQFKFKTSNVLVSLLDPAQVPLASWLFRKAYPVSWRVSDLDATANAVVIETLELAYYHMQRIRL